MRRLLSNLLLVVVVLAAFFYFYGRPWNDQPHAAPWPDSANTVVSWYVVGSENARLHIHEAFEDARGWQQAGIDFQEKETASGLADIVIIIFDPEAQNPCAARNVWGTACARGNGAALNGRGCVIYIPKGYSGTEVMTIFINHEAGHCLGFMHLAEGNLMRRTFERNIVKNVTDGPFWPTEEEIAALKRRAR